MNVDLKPVESHPDARVDDYDPHITDTGNDTGVILQHQEEKEEVEPLQEQKPMAAPEKSISPAVNDLLQEHNSSSDDHDEDDGDLSTNPHTRISSLFPDPSKPSLLCLHGYKSNGQITTLQLENLAMGKNFDVHVLHGPIESDKPAEQNMALLSSGPYYSWMEMDNTRTISDGHNNELPGFLQTTNDAGGHNAVPQDIFSGSVLQKKQPNFGAIFDGVKHHQYQRKRSMAGGVSDYDPYTPRAPTTPMDGASAMDHYNNKRAMMGSNSITGATTYSTEPSSTSAVTASTTMTVPAEFTNAPANNNNNMGQPTPTNTTTMPTGGRSSSMHGGMTLGFLRRATGKHRSNSVDHSNGNNNRNNSLDSSQGHGRRGTASHRSNSFDHTNDENNNANKNGMGGRSVQRSGSISNMAGEGVGRGRLQKKKSVGNMRRNSLGVASGTAEDNAASPSDDRRHASDPVTLQQEQLRGQFDETMAGLRYLLQHLVQRTEEMKKANLQSHNANANNGGAGGGGGANNEDFDLDSSNSSSLSGGAGGRHNEDTDGSYKEGEVPVAYDAVYAFSQAASLVSIISHTQMRRRLMKEFGMMSPFPEQSSKQEIKPWNFVILGCAANSTAHRMIRWYLFEQHVCHPMLVLKRDRDRMMAIEAHRRMQAEREERENPAGTGGVGANGTGVATSTARPRIERRRSFLSGGGSGMSMRRMSNMDSSSGNDLGGGRASTSMRRLTMQTSSGTTDGTGEGGFRGRMTRTGSILGGMSFRKTGSNRNLRQSQMEDSNSGGGSGPLQPETTPNQTPGTAGIAPFEQQPTPTPPPQPKRSHRSRSMLGAMSFSSRKLRAASMTGATAIPTSGGTPNPSAQLPEQDTPVVNNTDFVGTMEEVTTKKRTRRSSLAGVMRRLSVSNALRTGQDTTELEKVPNDEELQKALAVEEGICERCGEDLNDKEGYDDLIDVPSAQFIGIEDALKSESEYYLLQYKPESAMAVYLDSGHEIPAFLKKVDAIAEDVMLWRELRGQQRRRRSEASLTTLGEGSMESDGDLGDGFEIAPPPPADVGGFENAPPPDKFNGFEDAPPPPVGENTNDADDDGNKLTTKPSMNMSDRGSRRKNGGVEISSRSEHGLRTGRKSLFSRGSFNMNMSERSSRRKQAMSQLSSHSEHGLRSSQEKSTAQISSTSEHGGKDHGIDASEHSMNRSMSSRKSKLRMRLDGSVRSSRRQSTAEASARSIDLSGRSKRKLAGDMNLSNHSERLKSSLPGSLSWIFKRLEEELDDDESVGSGVGTAHSSRRRRSSVRSVGSMFSRIKGKRKHDAPEDVSLVRVNNDMIHFQQKRKRRIENAHENNGFSPYVMLDDTDVPRLDSRVPYAQYFLNDIEFSESSTLFDLLSDVDNTCAAALYSPTEPAYSISYLEILSFIRTNGDLRRLYATKDSLVAYVPPPGAGGIISALAFLTIAAQCTAAPLDPSYSMNDYDAAFEQLNPDIMVVFDPIDPKPVLEAASKRNCKVYIASPTSDGYFTYYDALTMDEMPIVESSTDDGLVNEAEGVGLLLRTSGTTSKPKVVPLKIGSIVSNARVISQSLGLEPSDVALNAMPLFHIGGISANLLSSLASSGGCILAETFDADSFCGMLVSETCGVQPTWFSAVPTMHATITATAESLSSLSPEDFQHDLRFIRSGAAALPNDLAQKMESVFGCPVVGTYSMTEQMPISQPHNLFEIKPRSVGKPLATSLCIVDKNLRPLPFGSEQHGEVCIAGDPVFEGYQGNDTANMKAFFFIGSMRWFRTGDMGYLDRDGYLFLTGRNKEMIKRGGEQINPLEVEEACKGHPLIKMCVAFAIPDKLWGQRLGLAVVLDAPKLTLMSEDNLVQELKQNVIKQGLQELKAPEKVVYVQEQDIPMTSSKKVIRVGLSDKLGVKPMSDDVMERLQDLKPFPSISEALSGVRFFLAFAVLYNHIGNFGKRIDHARFFCMHVPAFFFIGGFILAAGSKNNVIKKADMKGFYGLRLAIIHPMYMVSLVCAIINFVFRCNPSNYIEEFDPVREPLPGEEYVCQSTMVEMPYGWAMFSSLIMHIFALQAWPFSLALSWFILIYPWFQSVYYFCLFCFPWLHRQFHAQRRNKKALWKLMVFWLCSNYIMVGVFRLYFPLYENDPNFANIFALMAYLFPPGWLPSFSLGVGAYFLFSLYRPNEKLSVWIWGLVTDSLTFGFLVIFLLFALLPDETTPERIDTDIDQRYFAYFLSRITAPAIFVWIFGLAVGRGLTARLMSNSFLVTWLAPASYNMYLFHQVVQEWYYLATRGYWFAKPKAFYWFSPYPTPVPGWEFIIIALLTMALAVFLEVFVNGWLVQYSTNFTRWILCLKEKKVEGENVSETITSIIKNISGVEVEEDTNLLDTGLSSMTTLLLISDLVQIYPTLKLGARDVFGAKTVKGLIDIVEEHLKEAVVATSGLDGFGIDPDDDHNIRDIHIVPETAAAAGGGTEQHNGGEKVV